MVLSPEIRKGKWTADEDTQLIDAIRRYGEGNWTQIAKDIEGRTQKQCSYRWNFVLNLDNKKGCWTDEEDKRLSEAFAKYGPKWTLIASVLNGRNPMQCRKRWRRTLDPTLKRGKWSKDEDEALREAIAIHGKENWPAISAGVPGRSDAQCYERWYMGLSPDIKRGKWTRKEDQELRDTNAKHGVSDCHKNGRSNTKSVPYTVVYVYLP
ncbi:Myb-like DNA-binding domain protein [Quaeritorhiza haematococci]|nr:Myb-like DNA-binding domain protein [Quaeritorhiza haematococci]